MAQIFYKVRKRLVVLRGLEHKDLQLGLEMTVLKNELCMVPRRVPLGEVTQVLKI